MDQPYQLTEQQAKVLGLPHDLPEDEGDYMQDALDEKLLAANLAELVNGECDSEDFEEVWDPDWMESFEAAGVLTSDEGFRFRLGDGRMAYVTVKIQGR